MFPEIHPTTEKHSTDLLERIAHNDLAAVKECLEAHGAWVWGVAKKHSDSALAAEQLTILIFRDIWKYAHRFKTSGLDEQIFIALIARRRVKREPIAKQKKFGSDNRFNRSFHRYANAGHA